jgi:hypothetical protein
MPRNRQLLGAVAVMAAVLAPSSAVAATGTAIPAPAPPQNPFLATTPFSNIHNDTWMTDAYATAGPSGTKFTTKYGPLSPSLCSAMVFDTHGRIITICPSTAAPPTLRIIDPKTLKVVADYAFPAGAPPPAGTKAFQNFTGGGYFYLDRKNRVTTATKTNHIFVMAETPSGRGVKRVADYNLTKYLTGTERITSALPDFSGRIWFVSKKDGKIGVLDPKTKKVHVKRTGEEIENSFAVGKDGIYIVSDKRMYKLNAGKDGVPRTTWSSKYRNSGIVKPSQVDAGSGTTPTIMSGGYVAITDNADPMDVVVYRTATKLKKGQRRVVCQVPVFSKGGSATENSLNGAGRSLIVENNYGYQDPFGPNAGAVTKGGIARVDVAKNGKGCRKIWTNTSVHSPTVVPKLSTKTQIEYTYEQDAGVAGGVWSWVGLSARSGKQVFKVHAGDGLIANNNYAGIGLGPDGSAYVGTIGGIRKLSNAK